MFISELILVQLCDTQKLKEEGEVIFEISCDNFGCFAKSLCPIKFDLNCRLKKAFVLELYFTSANLYTKSINRLALPVYDANYEYWFYVSELSPKTS